MRHAIIVAKLKLTNDVRQAMKEFQRFCEIFSSSSSDRDPRIRTEKLSQPNISQLREREL